MRMWNALESMNLFQAIFIFHCVIICSSMYVPCAVATMPPSSLEIEEAPQKVRKGDPSTVVAVAIADKSTIDMSFPRLKFVNDSTEFHEEDERIAKDSVMISGVASRFGKRSVRAYPSSSQLMLVSGLGNQFHTRNYNRYNRFDDRRNGMDSDGSSPSSSSWGGKWFSTLRRRTSMMMNPMMNQQFLQNQGSADEPEMAATFLGGGGGGGWGQSSHYGKGGVNKSAVGLLGFLSLLSLIQNVLNQTQSMQGRRKRDLSGGSSTEEDLEFDDYDWEQSVAEMTKLTPYVLPMLNAVMYAQSGKIPVKCTLQPICLTNHALITQLGSERGKLVGQIISDAISKSLKEAAWRRKTLDFNVKGIVVRAGKSGRNGKSCKNIYEKCPELDQLPHYISKKSVATLISEPKY